MMMVVQYDLGLKKICENYCNLLNGHLIEWASHRF